MEVPTYSPREIVSELDRFIVGQNDAKRAVAIALRNRWRRQQLPEAMLVVCDAQSSLIISGNGDVLEPEQGLVAIGSGGPYAQAAARALLENTPMPPEEIVKKALTIAGDLCIYTNQQHVIEILE